MNEQPLEFWRDLFAEHGYRCFDAIRGRIARQGEVEPWYRHNTLLYVADAAVAALPEEVRHTDVAAGQSITEVAPLAWRARSAIVRSLPAPVVDGRVRLKHWWKRA